MDSGVGSVASFSKIVSVTVDASGAYMYLGDVSSDGVSGSVRRIDLLDPNYGVATIVQSIPVSDFSFSGNGAAIAALVSVATIWPWLYVASNSVPVIYRFDLRAADPAHPYEPTDGSILAGCNGACDPSIDRSIY